MLPNAESTCRKWAISGWRRSSRSTELATGSFRGERAYRPTDIVHNLSSSRAFTIIHTSGVADNPAVTTFSKTKRRRLARSLEKVTRRGIVGKRRSNGIFNFADAKGLARHFASSLRPSCISVECHLNLRMKFEEGIKDLTFSASSKSRLGYF